MALIVIKPKENYLLKEYQYYFTEPLARTHKQI